MLFEEQFASLPFNLPQIQNKLPSGWIRSCVISSRQLTMWAIQTQYYVYSTDFYSYGPNSKGIRALSLLREQINYTRKFVLLTTFIKLRQRTLKFICHLFSDIYWSVKVCPNYRRIDNKILRLFCFSGNIRTQILKQTYTL